MAKNQYNGKLVKKAGLSALKRSLEPIGPNSQAIRSSTDIIEGAGGEGGGAEGQCYFCGVKLPENQLLNVKVKPFEEGHSCRDCAKSRRLEQLDFWDEWTFWG